MVFSQNREVILYLWFKGYRKVCGNIYIQIWCYFCKMLLWASWYSWVRWWGAALEPIAVHRIYNPFSCLKSLSYGSILSNWHGVFYTWVTREHSRILGLTPNALIHISRGEIQMPHPLRLWRFRCRFSKDHILRAPWKRLWKYSWHLSILSEVSLQWRCSTIGFIISYFYPLSLP